MEKPHKKLEVWKLAMEIAEYIYKLIQDDKMLSGLIKSLKIVEESKGLGVRSKGMEQRL